MSRIQELKNELMLYYQFLEEANNYAEEKLIDGEIHKFKKELSKYGIYVKEHVTVKFILSNKNKR